MNRFSIISILIFFLSSVSFPIKTFAHGLALEKSRQTSVDSAMSVTWRSAAVVDDNTAWRIPGFLMGGESWPVDEGVGIDEFSLSAQYATDKNFYTIGKAGVHAGGKGSDHGDSLELQHAYLGWRNNCHNFCFAAEAGKMSALFSPAMAEHPSARLFSESSLLMDSFFGRDFHDQGVRILLQSPLGISGGFEQWRGQVFPSTATDSGGNADVFVRYDFHGDSLIATIGSWYMQADADNRVDHRYSADHLHSNNITPLFPSVGFTGRSDLQGLHANARWNFFQDWAFELGGEWIDVQMDGVLQNNLRSANYRGDLNGYWVQPAIHWRQHSIGIRFEQLRADNQVEGAGAPALTLDSGLATRNHTPERISFIWSWQLRKSFRLRLEAIDDRSLPDDASRIALGIVWRQNLWFAQ